jgi:hypothetical protein
MHCKMNLAKNFLKTIYRKDTVKVRKDLQRKGLRRHLWLTNNPCRPGKMFKPAAPYILTDGEFAKFAKCIESIKTPSGYASALGKHIRKKKFGGLKSHDYHVFMQQILPLALWGLLQWRSCGCAKYFVDYAQRCITWWILIHLKQTLR